MKEIEADVLPFGFVDDGLPQVPQFIDEEKAAWQIEHPIVDY